jgi:tetratricopeptide (TPR) repeat protein
MRWVVVAVLLLQLIPTACTAGETCTLGDYLTQAWAAENRGNFIEARKNYTAALDIKPDDPSLNFKIAEMLLRSNNPTEAAKYLVATLRLLKSDSADTLPMRKTAWELLLGKMPWQWGRNGEPLRVYPVPATILSANELKELAAKSPVEEDDGYQRLSTHLPPVTGMHKPCCSWK